MASTVVRCNVAPLGAALSILLVACSERPPPSAARPASSQVAWEFVGSAACAGCHAEQSRQFSQSHHARSMQAATNTSVLAEFSSLAQTHAGWSRTGASLDGKHVLTALGSQSQRSALEVRYTFGVYPLQQYLVPGARGRLQVYDLAWDARSKAAGGQRWFDPASATGAASSAPPWIDRTRDWNGMCAACHSTGLRKGYDASSDSFETTWKELNVGCEACHGRGSRHAAWARAGAHASSIQNAGFEVPLRGASAHRWTFDRDQPIAHASGARGASIADASAEVNRCLPCHARRLELTPEPRVGGPLLDDYAPSLIEQGLYHVDGQVDDEDFEYGSFAQSRMHLAGVTCSNCHDPHRGTLVAQGNALCAQCHAPTRYDAANHHHHAVESTGAQCVNCHMRSQTFMGVHVRRDHAIRIPRPDLTVRYGVPNACTNCHVERSAAWAARTLEQQGASLGDRDASFAEAIDAGRNARSGANARLAELILREDLAPIQRASATALLRGMLSPPERTAFERSAGDVDPLVRLGAARALDALGPDERILLGARLLADPLRAVRIEAARALADAPSAQLNERQRAQLATALREWFVSRQSTAERPETHVDVAQVYTRLQRGNEAERELRHALRLDPANLAARVNLADLLRATARDAEAEVSLRETVALQPTAAVAWHALGLTLVRQQRRSEALDALQKAHVLAPREPDYAYAYALALHEAGRATQARDILKRAIADNPSSEELTALWRFVAN